MPPREEADARNLQLLQANGTDPQPPYDVDAYVEWATDKACEGQLGNYQRKVLLLLASSWVLTAMHTFSWGFITVEPDIKPDDILPVIVGRVLILDGRDSCNPTEIEEWGAACPELDERHCVPAAMGENTSSSVFRDRWTYRDKQNSAKAEFDLSVCSGSPDFATRVSQFFWYFFALGVVSSGVVSDALGRKLTYTSYLSLMLVGGVCMAVASSRWVLAFGRMVDAFGIGGFSIAGFIWASESLNAEAQHYMTWVPNAWFILGGWIPSILTVWVSNWRHFSWIVALACIPFFFVPPLCFESPKWLAAKQQRSAVWDVMKGISRANGKAEPAQPPERGSNAEAGEESKAAQEVAPSGDDTSTVLLHPKVLPRLLLNSALWLVVSFSYYGLSLFAPPPLFDPQALEYAVVLNWCFGFAVELPAYLSSGIIINTRLGRKGSCAGAIAAGGAFLLLAGLQPELPEGEELPQAQALFFALLYYLARMMLASGFAVIYPWSAELFPSTVRSTAMGFTSFWARMGSSFAPLAGDVKPFSLRMTIFGIPAVIVASVALVMLPETRGKRLPGSLTDL